MPLCQHRPAQVLPVPKQMDLGLTTFEMCVLITHTRNQLREYHGTLQHAGSELNFWLYLALPVESTTLAMVEQHFQRMFALCDLEICRPGKKLSLPLDRELFNFFAAELVKVAIGYYTSIQSKDLLSVWRLVLGNRQARRMELNDNAEKTCVVDVEFAGKLARCFQV